MTTTYIREQVEDNDDRMRRPLQSAISNRIKYLKQLLNTNANTKHHF